MYFLSIKLPVFPPPVCSPSGPCHRRRKTASPRHKSVCHFPNLRDSVVTWLCFFSTLPLFSSLNISYFYMSSLNISYLYIAYFSIHFLYTSCLYINLYISYLYTSYVTLYCLYSSIRNEDFDRISLRCLSLQKINWEDLAAKKVPAPFKPVVRDELDVSNFALEFTGMDAMYSPADLPQSCDRIFQVGDITTRLWLCCHRSRPLCVCVCV